MPLTEKGFQRLTFDEVLSVMIDRAKIVYGEDIDTSDLSVFGKYLRLYCYDGAANQELTEKVLQQFSARTAIGVFLDRLCPNVGITRNPATYAQHEIKVKGTAGEAVDTSFLVSSGDVVFHVIDNYTIGTDGTVSVVVECNEAGTVGNVAKGSITDIVNPVANIDSIEHTAVIKTASDEESDYDLRRRYTQALSGVGSGTADAIMGALLRVSGVESVLIEVNDTVSYDSHTPPLPPHSFRCYVLAPHSTQAQIARTIFEKKPIGITTVGNVTNDVKDIGGGIHKINFSWISEVQIYVKCSISVDGTFSESSLQEIKDNIVSKINSYGAGQDVTSTSLYGVVYVDGVSDVTSLEISKNGSTYSTGVIGIANSEAARTAVANIEVTVNE